MLARAIFAFLALPGMLALLIPLSIGLRELHVDGGFQAIGLLPLLTGLGLLLWCVHDFYVAGKGTLAPWAPPEQLVTSGLYRYSRNPMYIAVLLMLAGWALLFGSLTLGIYAASTAVAFHLRVVFGEEPWLAHNHGNAWVEYEARVPRWLL